MKLMGAHERKHAKKRQQQARDLLKSLEGNEV